MVEGPLGPRILGNKIESYGIIPDHEQGLMMAVTSLVSTVKSPKSSSVSGHMSGSGPRALADPDQ